MSTPSGKPSNPIDLPAYEPRLARGHATAERHTSGQTAKSFEGETIAMVHGGGIGAPAPSPVKAKRVLDPEEIKLLTKRGEQFAASGYLVTARILFQRAAEAGDATAAMALGATYDPNVLAKLGVVGMGADVEKARSWYRKAESFGSSEASLRLNAIANR
jgi:TPR repeat protein